MLPGVQFVPVFVGWLEAVVQIVYSRAEEADLQMVLAAVVALGRCF